MSDQNYDRFADVKNRETGIFSGQIEGHDRVLHTVTKDGVAYEFHCPGCGAPTQITVEWPELVAMKYGMNPAVLFRGMQQVVRDPMSFVFEPEEKAWRPDVKCPRGCDFWLCIRIMPDEPERLLMVGRRSSFINPQGEAQVEAICQQAAARRGGMAPTPVMPRR